MLGKKRAHQDTTCQVKVTLEAEMLNEEPIPPLVEEFVMEDEDPYLSLFHAPSPSSFSESSRAKMVEASRYSTMRSPEKSRKIQFVVQEFVSEAQASFDPIINIVCVYIVERDRHYLHLRETKKIANNM